jgi:hypothetical protein
VAGALTKCNYGEGSEIDDMLERKVPGEPRPGFERRGELVGAQRRGRVVHS